MKEPAELLLCVSVAVLDADDTLLLMVYVPSSSG